MRQQPAFTSLYQMPQNIFTLINQCDQQQSTLARQTMENNRCNKCVEGQKMNESNSDRLSFYLICEGKHVLCEQCYPKNNSIAACPFKNCDKSILKLNGKVRGFHFGNSITSPDAKLLRYCEQIRQPQIIPLNPPNLNTLTSELQKIQKQNHERFLILNCLFSLIQIASTTLQLILLFSSINSGQQQNTSIILYMVNFYLALVLISSVYYLRKAKIFIQWNLFIIIQHLIAVTLGSPIIFLPLYLQVLMTNKMLRVSMSKSCCNSCFSQFPKLTFECVNHSFLLGKLVIFLQYYFRFYDLTTSRLNLTVFILALLEMIALIGSDLSYYLLMKRQKIMDLTQKERKYIQ